MPCNEKLRESDSRSLCDFPGWHVYEVVIDGKVYGVAESYEICHRIDSRDLHRVHERQGSRDTESPGNRSQPTGEHVTR